jgi:hypothetical protein
VAALASPFVGARPFRRDEASWFHGRETEAREAVDLISAAQVVVLYGSSGAGKTSLVNAAVIPRLEAEDFEVLPVARVRAPYDAGTPDIGNVYVDGVLSAWDGRSRPPADADLVRFLGNREHVRGRDGYPAPRVIVIDQAEELFYLYPERWQDRTGFFEQIARALEQDDLLRVVFSLREEYVAELDPYARMFRAGFRSRLRLRPLVENAALRAVQGPLALTDRRFAPGVAEALVDDLLTIRVDRGDSGPFSARGEFVEPFLLQVVCSTLWSRLGPEATVIGPHDVASAGDSHEILTSLWDRAMESAARTARIPEKQLRADLEAALITPANTRSIVYRGAADTAGIPNEALDMLEHEHLVRSEFRAGARWHELTHDRLIAPVRASNERFRRSSSRSRSRFGRG